MVCSHKLIAFMAIVFSIVVFPLCGHSRAAPVRYKECTRDYERNQGEFCRQNSSASYCALCLDCNRYDREPSSLLHRLVEEIVMAVIVMAIGVVAQRSKRVVGGGVEELNENNDNEDELDEDSMDLEPLAGNDTDADDPIAINENRLENSHDVEHNDDHHLNLDGNNEHQVNEDNNNRHLMDLDDDAAGNALQDVWQDPEDPGIFQFHPEVGGFHSPLSPNVAGASGYEGDQVVPDIAHHNYFNLQQGLQILGGDLVQNFHDGMSD